MENIKYLNHALQNKFKIEVSQECKTNILLATKSCSTSSEYFESFLNLIGIEAFEKDMVMAKTIADGIYYLQKPDERPKRHFNLKQYCSLRKLDKTKVYSVLKDNGLVFSQKPTAKAIAESAIIGSIYEYGGEITYSYLWQIDYLDTVLEKTPKSKKDKTSPSLSTMPKSRSTTIRAIEKRTKEIYDILEKKNGEDEDDILASEYYFFVVYEAELTLFRIYGDDKGTRYHRIKQNITRAFDYSDELIKSKNIRSSRYIELRDDVLKLLNHYENKYL